MTTNPYNEHRTHLNIVTTGDDIIIKIWDYRWHLNP